jgi:DNA-binding IclR family transcriptional regulator
MSSLTKLLSILDFFTPGMPLLTADEITSRLGCSRPQGYRYIRELYAAGLLTRFSGGYSLGPRIIELDFVIRSGDPLLQSSVPLIRELRDRVGCHILLHRMYGDRLVTIHHERADGTTPVGFGRGQPMPLFRGAGYKVVLANLPPARQKKLFAAYPGEIQNSTLGKTWEAFRADLRKIRKDGYAISLGELDTSNVAIAAPIFHELEAPPSAFVFVLPMVRYQTSNHAALIKIVVEGAAEITRRAREHRQLRPKDTSS